MNWQRGSANTRVAPPHNRQTPGIAEDLCLSQSSGTQELRYLAVSTEHSLEMAQYPDSGKYAVKAEFGTAPDGTLQRFVFVGRENQSVAFWDGE